MARKRRIEYPGAVYHVISRGNYRKELFLQEGSGRRFEERDFMGLDVEFKHFQFPHLGFKS
jgi:REP element-mobilizing transposase RayT